MPYYRSTAYIISQGFQKVLIYYFTIFLLITTNFQNWSFKYAKTKEKGMQILHRGSFGKHKLNASESVLLSTIQTSLWFADRPSPFFEFLREALHAVKTEEHAVACCCRPEEARRRRWGGGGAPRGAWRPCPQHASFIEAKFWIGGGRRWGWGGEPIWAVSGANWTLGLKWSLKPANCSSFFI